MDPGVCTLNVAATDDPGFEYDVMITKAVSKINGGNGVDIDDIAVYIKERYELPSDFRKQLKVKLGILVSGDKLVKANKRYKIRGGVVTTTEDTTEPGVSEDVLKVLITEMKQLVAETKEKMQAEESSILMRLRKMKKIPPSNKSLVQVKNSFQILKGITEDTNLTQIPKRKDQTTSAVFKDLAIKMIAVAEHLEFKAKEISQYVDKLDQLCEESHKNLMLAKEIYQQCRQGNQIPLVQFTDNVYEDWLLDLSRFH